jgi:hypothetical protein
MCKQYEEAEGTGRVVRRKGKVVAVGKARKAGKAGRAVGKAKGERAGQGIQKAKADLKEAAIGGGGKVGCC